MKLVEFARKSNSFIILAPVDAEIPAPFRSVRSDGDTHSRVLSEMQKLRGRIALKEGAVQASALDREGRHHMPGDLDSWHLIRTDETGTIRGCARILVHSKAVTFPELRLAHSEVARNPLWKHRVRRAVEADIAAARKQSYTMVEPGGWVVDEECRGGKHAAAIALSAVAWSQLVGDCLAYLTATVKHGSSSILRKLGASALSWGGEEIPKYYDPAYGCHMELLKIQTTSVNRRFDEAISQLKSALVSSEIVQAGPRPKTMTRLAA